MKAPNVTTFPTPAKKRVEPKEPIQPKPAAKEVPKDDGGIKAMQAIAEALKDQIAKQPEPMTFKFDISRGEDGRISAITATPVKGSKQ